MKKITLKIVLGVLSLFCSLQGVGQTETVCRETVNAHQRTSYEYVSTVELTPGFEYDATIKNKAFNITPYQARPCSDPSGCGSVCDAVEPFHTTVEVIRKEGVKTDAQADLLTDAEHIVSTEYVDGLARTQLSVISHVSPDKQDLVKAYEYDEYGRMIKNYLPFVESDQVSHFEKNPLTRQSNFYKTNTAQEHIQRSDFAYSEIDIERSPLQRVLEVGATGESWQLGQHTAKSRMGVNGANAVRQWKQHVDGHYYSDSFYPEGTLSKVTVTDEEGHNVTEYRDGFGNVIFSRAEHHSQDYGQAVNYVGTYNIYDDLLRLVHTISPNAVAKMQLAVADDRWIVEKGQPLTDEFVESFDYDKRGRLIKNNLQGAKSNEYVYDKFDRLVTFRNAEMKADDKWWFVKYDYLNRPVMSGVVETPNKSRNAVETEVKISELHKEKVYEKRASSTVTDYYTNTTYPTQGTVLNAYYYDHRDLNLDGTDDYQLNSTTAYANQTTEENLIGMSVASKTAVLGEADKELWSYSFYDEYYRAIQVRSNNILTSTISDEVNMAYNDHYEVTAVKESHTVNGTLSQLETTFSYDHIGRPTKASVKLNNNPIQEVCSYEYNEFGMLVEKNIHKQADNTYLQSVDYAYNIRGWVTGINELDFGTSGTNNDTDDLFALKLMYDNPDQTIGGVRSRYDGMLSGVVWNTNYSGQTSVGTQRERSYSYFYDGLNRLTQADYVAKSSTGDWTEEKGGYNTRYTYDRNGNIRSLKRYQQDRTTNTRTLIDDLHYSYTDIDGNQSNKVQHITDGGRADLGYRASTNTTEKYGYDKVGNMNYDPAKGVSIGHNTLLNLPSKISKSATEELTFVYSASGAKIGKKYKNADELTETYYIGSFVYENASLSYVSIAGGRIVTNSGGMRYEYNLTDHLGNTRVTFTEEQQTGKAIILQENHYYPYGLEMQGVAQGMAIPSDGNPYQHGGKEKHDELGLDWYMYSLRTYDPTIGRWLQQDPYNEFFSPYCGMGDNPANFNDPTGGVIRIGSHKFNTWAELSSYSGNNKFVNQVKTALLNINGSSTAKGVLDDFLDNEKYDLEIRSGGTNFVVSKKLFVWSPDESNYSINYNYNHSDFSGLESMSTKQQQTELFDNLEIKNIRNNGPGAKYVVNEVRQESDILLFHEIAHIHLINSNKKAFNNNKNSSIRFKTSDGIDVLKTFWYSNKEEKRVIDMESDVLRELGRNDEIRNTHHGTAKPSLNGTGGHKSGGTGMHYNGNGRGAFNIVNYNTNSGNSIQFHIISPKKWNTKGVSCPLGCSDTDSNYNSNQSNTTGNTGGQTYGNAMGGNY